MRRKKSDRCIKNSVFINERNFGNVFFFCNIIQNLDFFFFQFQAKCNEILLTNEKLKIFCFLQIDSTSFIYAYYALYALKYYLKTARSILNCFILLKYMYLFCQKQTKKKNGVHSVYPTLTPDTNLNPKISFTTIFWLDRVDHHLQHKPMTGIRGWQISWQADMIQFTVAEQIGSDVGWWRISLEWKSSRKSEAQVFNGIL